MRDSLEILGTGRFRSSSLSRQSLYNQMKVEYSF